MGSQTETFWSSNQPGFRFARAPVGSAAFFNEVEQHRYRLEPHIPEVVRFERWAGFEVLEAGCGIGTDALQFARAGARYTGLDSSSSALALAARRFDMAQAEGTFVCGSVTKLPFGDDSFDLVYSHGVIHHIPDTKQAVAEFRRVLRPGGVAIVMVYHRNSLNYRFTIMVLRRGLIVVLLVPGGLTAVSKLTGEAPELLDAHRSLLRGYGLRYLSADRFLSNNTDGPGNPLSKAYSRRDARELFADFSRVRLETRFLNLRLYPRGDRLAATRLARRIERKLGWHLYVEAVK